MNDQLARAEQVRLNRVQTEYMADELPNQEQIRYDVAWLIVLVLRLSDKLEKVHRRK